jgi:tryptophanyl-tRNA synthetase
MKKVLLSGVKPTGRPHLGNYFGAMKQFVDLQDDYDSHIFIADFHALTSVQNRDSLEENIINEFLDYLAIGLDPKKVTIFKQSDVPEVTELSWIFDCITTMPYLMRAHAFKDAEAKDKEINVGVFNYPILMAADILLPESDVVPVGKDQKQHVEYARDIAEKFNRIYGDTFKLPKELILEDVQTIPGTDGQKMSKSYGNTIPLFATDEEIKKAVMSIPTDSAAIEDSKNPDESVIYQIHSLVLNDEQKQSLRKRFEEGGLGYKEAKENLIEDLIKFISPMREKREELAKNKNKIIKVLQKGGKRMRKKIQPKMNEVRKKIGIKIY